MIGRHSFRQTLVGSHRSLADDSLERPLSLSLSSERPRLLPPVSGRIDVVGEIDARGLADHRPVRGTLSTPRALLGASVYDLEFVANDGQRLRLHASREPRLREPLWSLSRVVGTIATAEGGRAIGRVELRLDFKTALGRLLGK